MSLSRRELLVGAAIGAAATLGGSGSARAQGRVLTMGDPGYAAATLRGYNRRFLAQPQRVVLASTGEQVCEAVAAAVQQRMRPAVRAGGHCFDDFVDNPETQVLVDVGQLDEIGWDERYRAFSVGAGARLGAVYAGLDRWGVTIPAGICQGVGAGGHFSGGGYGPLSRRHGLVADHLFGVEVVTVDERGRARAVVATREGPHQDLWWAHTGGGGGNFGVVTRFLLRSPGVDGADPRAALPRSPDSLFTARMFVPIATEDMFVRLLRNYLDFFYRYRDPGNPFAGLYAPLSVRPTATGFAEMLILADAQAPDARDRLEAFVAAVCDGVSAPLLEPATRASYAETVQRVYYTPAPQPPRVKVKAAYLRRPYTDEQLRICYRRMVDASVIGESELEFLPFGAAINAVAPGATAMPARDSFLTMLIHTAWRLPGDDEHFLGWAREFYGALYADSGGVPVPDARNGGSYINYPDPDLADARFNRSGRAWHELYYGAGYARLQRVKARWDPGAVFAHRLAVRAR
ncbi:FAD-binding oxidoreductase [Nocardia pseudobrasiliensis]|uniref:FAD/FMN-containing dehydrogenase n=1 Tax=Nocardia pseudobrasiliensis TaxID=45979 RepID=A0A370HYE5_9NOCA|nr:FAD-binding protein [Nocardia pseudobrasiliensis]RDI63522.1 FAD/FMN-containing dehydrogenase [Nocardia pseudobrasiliensis]